MTVRPARQADASAIAVLVSQLGYETTEAEVTARIGRMLARSDQQVIVAHDGDRLLGWVHVELAESMESGTCAAIGGLVVDRAHRRQGIGAALMAEAEAWARQQGCSVMRLRSSTSRVPAHRFYAGLGYMNVKTQYTFVKALDTGGAEQLRGLVPRMDETA